MLVVLTLEAHCMGLHTARYVLLVQRSMLATACSHACQVFRRGKLVVYLPMPAPMHVMCSAGGNSYNQLAVLATYEQDELGAAFYYLRLACL